MSTIKSFKDLKSWQLARVLAADIHRLTQQGTFSRDYALKDQINRSSGSVMDNIAEGFERDGSREFIQFLAIAKGSLGEVRSQLIRATDKRHIDENALRENVARVDEIGRLIGGLMKYLAKCGLKGNKFKFPDTGF